MEACHRTHPGDVACAAYQVAAGPADVEANLSGVVGELPAVDLFARMTSNCSMNAVVTQHYQAKRICWVRSKLATAVASVTTHASQAVSVAYVVLVLVLSEQQE